MKNLFFLAFTIFFLSCSTEEEDEPCVETFCPEGATSCVDVPCDLDDFRINENS